MGECSSGFNQRQTQLHIIVGGYWHFAFQPRGPWSLPKIGQSDRVLPEGLAGPRELEQRHQFPTLRRAHDPHRERHRDFYQLIVSECHLLNRPREGNNGIPPLEGEFRGGQPNATACTHDQNVFHNEVKSALKNRH